MKRSHSSFPLREFMNVSASPIIISASRARDNRTFSRSGDDMNPISCRELLRVNEIIAMSLSSPW